MCFSVPLHLNQCYQCCCTVHFHPVKCCSAFQVRFHSFAHHTQLLHIVYVFVGVIHNDRAFEAPRLQMNQTTNMCGSGLNCEKLDASLNTAGYIILLLVVWIAAGKISSLCMLVSSFQLWQQRHRFLQISHSSPWQFLPVLATSNHLGDIFCLIDSSIKATFQMENAHALVCFTKNLYWKERSCTRPFFLSFALCHM